MAASIIKCRAGGSYQALHSFLISRCSGAHHLPSQLYLHTSQSHQIDRRKEKAIAQHLHFRDHEKTIRIRQLPIHSLPDYSYIDGRPTEFSISQKERQRKNTELASRVVQFVGEIKFAQEQIVSQQKNAERKIKVQQDSKLKEKGIKI